MTGTRRRWLLPALIALVLVALALLVGACGSAMYIHGLWEAGNHRCGQELGQRHGEALQRRGGWGIGFNGEADAFVCTVQNAKLRVVAREEIPVERVLGRSGGWPFFPELVAHELEAVDADAPQPALPREPSP